MHKLSKDQQALILTRNRLIPFSVALWPDYRPAKHLRLIANALEKIERGEIKNLAISMPPRHGKSQLASVYFPAWYMGRNPQSNVIFTSYGQSIANDFGYKVKTVFTNPTYKSIFPEYQLSDIAYSKNEMRSTSGGVYYAVGAGGPLTSRGGDCIIIDDPIKNREDAESELMREKIWSWYRSTLFTRKSPNATIILIQTRWHSDDLMGKILKEEASDWHILNLPAINDKNEAQIGRAHV